MNISMVSGMFPPIRCVGDIGIPPPGVDSNTHTHELHIFESHKFVTAKTNIYNKVGESEYMFYLRTGRMNQIDIYLPAPLMRIAGP